MNATTYAFTNTDLQVTTLRNEDNTLPVSIEVGEEIEDGCIIVTEDNALSFLAEILVEAYLDNKRYEHNKK
jgi:hypothetical protein